VRIGPLAQVLSLDHDAPFGTPALGGLIGKFINYPAGLASVEKVDLRLSTRSQAHGEQSRILGQPEHEVNTVGLTPGHAVFTGKARIATHDDLGLGPTRTDLLHDPSKLLDAAGGSIDVRGAQPGAQQILASEDVQRQVEVVALVTMEEAPFLLPVQGVVGRIQIQPDRHQRCTMGVDKAVHQRSVHTLGVGDNFLVALVFFDLFGVQFQTIERAGVGQRLTAALFGSPILALSGRACRPPQPAMERTAADRGR